MALTSQCLRKNGWVITFLPLPIQNLVAVVVVKAVQRVVQMSPEKVDRAVLRSDMLKCFEGSDTEMGKKDEEDREGGCAIF